MRFVVASLLVAFVAGQCQPACDPGMWCDASTAPGGRCIEDPCRSMQCPPPQLCRVETATGAPKGVCYTPSCTAAEQQQCPPPRSRCTPTATGAPECADPCQPAGTSGPVCPQTQPMCTANADGTVKCASPCDDPQACPAGATCRFDAASGTQCIFPDPCGSNPCAQNANKKCVADNAASPPTFTCVNACEPNPCPTTAPNCAQSTNGDYTCSAPTDPCSNHQCELPTPRCIVDQSSGTAQAKCIDPCTYSSTNPCAQSSQGPVCRPTAASPFYTCSNPCADHPCSDPTKPECVVVGGQATCQDPCTRNPCQNGETCNRKTTSPFFGCTPTNPCNPSPCTDASKPVCVAVSGATPPFRCDPVPNPCDANPCPTTSTCRADAAQPNGYSCIPNNPPNPCSPNPCPASQNICTQDASQPNGYKCSAPTPTCDGYECPATAPKCILEQAGTAAPQPKCVNPCQYSTANPCAQSSEGPLCKPAPTSPFYVCWNPCRDNPCTGTTNVCTVDTNSATGYKCSAPANPCLNFGCTSDRPQCVVVDGQPVCKNPCANSPSPCQSGQCNPRAESPFYVCTTTNPCQQATNPCTGTANICVADNTAANGYRCTEPVNPCTPNPCTDATKPVCVRDTTVSAGFTCQPQPTTDPCNPSKCNDPAKPICVRVDSTPTGYRCDPRPNPCADFPCRTNADQKYFCVPRQVSGANTLTYECQKPCDANPCAVGTICTYNAANTETLRTCTDPPTNPCATMLCPATKPICKSWQDAAAGTWRGECVNPCLAASGNPCAAPTTVCTAVAITNDNPRGFVCTAPVATCDATTCREGEICTPGATVPCTLPDPCAPSANGASKCPSGTNCKRIEPGTTSPQGTVGYTCQNPCEGFNCLVGTCVPTQTSSGTWVGVCPPPCGPTCVSPSRCVQDDTSATGAVAFKCISAEVCTATSCRDNQRCVPDATTNTGFTCVNIDPCSQCTGRQICVRDNSGNTACKDPCSVCTSSQVCNVDAVTGTATCTEQVCLKCQAAGSAGTKCGFDKANNGYVCYEDCVDSKCPTGQRCAPSANVYGKFECQAPPTCAQGAACPANQFCINGACREDPCATCNRADGFACTRSATGAWGCFFQPCAVLKPCLKPGEVCRDSTDATTNAVRGYTCIAPDNRATTAVQVSVTVTLNINADVVRSDPNFNANFARETADLVNIDKSRIEVTGVVASSTGEGSVVTFTVRPADSSAPGVQSSPTDVADRLNSKLEAAAATGGQVGNGQYTTAMATGAGAQQVQSAVYQCSNGQWVDSQSACPAPVASTNLTTLAVGVVVGVLGALALVAAVLYCKKNKTAGGATGTEMV